MSQFTGAGTCVAVSATAPATFDSAGYAALTYTTVGELQTWPEVNKDRSVSNFENLCTGKTTKVLGAESINDPELVVARDLDDAGQALLTAAYEAKSKLSVRVLESSGDTKYFQVNVTSRTLTGGAGVNDVVTSKFKLAIVQQAIGSTVVEINAP